MTRDELAKMIDGRQYREEITNKESANARDNRLLVVYGASDDLTEFDGLISDEVGAYDGAELVVFRTHGNQWGVGHEGDDASGGIPIKAEWCPDGFDGSWRISTPIPHATFRIMEDDDLYCQGIVIAESDMLAALTVA